MPSPISGPSSVLERTGILSTASSLINQPSATLSSLTSSTNPSTTLQSSISTSTLPPPPPPSTTFSTNPSTHKSPTTSQTSIADHPISRPRGLVNLNAYLLLFSSLVTYCHNRVTTVDDLETKLSTLGQRLGPPLLELYYAHQSHPPSTTSTSSKTPIKREIRIIHILSFISSTLWKFIFNKNIDSLKKVNNSESKFYIEEVSPITNKFISVPKDFGQLNCAAFVAGIVKGVLGGAGFEAEVEATFYPKRNDSSGIVPRTIYYISFSEQVMERERRLR